MRPVNLIPVEQRSGQRRPMRGGPIAYIVVGALAAALLGVTTLVVADNQISDSKAKITQLNSERAAVDSQAAALAAYTQFHAMREQRVTTVTGLADSRFDWERVMRELALVLPSDVWLTNLTGTANPETAPEGAANVSLRTSIPGPALELVGCARDQEAVAGLVQAIKSIDGVTRIGVPSSKLGTGSGGTSSAGSTSGGTSASCQTRDFIAQFQMVAAFDAAPVSSEAAGATEAVPAPTPETTATTTSEE